MILIPPRDHHRPHLSRQSVPIRRPRRRTPVDSDFPGHCDADVARACQQVARSEEHTSELQSLMRISYAVFCLKKKKNTNQIQTHNGYNTKNMNVKNDTDATHTNK